MLKPVFVFRMNFRIQVIISKPLWKRIGFANILLLSKLNNSRQTSINTVQVETELSCSCVQFIMITYCGNLLVKLPITYELGKPRFPNCLKSSLTKLGSVDIHLYLFTDLMHY